MEFNNFYDNNFNPYTDTSDVDPFIPAPVGTGLWLAGGNNNVVRHNRFYDNWRRGVMLFAVPDATVCGPPPVGSATPVPGCDPAGVSTSYGNRFHGNTMGVSPKGAAQPNGTDFWWDNFAGNTGNCWWDNTAAPGQSVTTSPLLLPDCSGGTDPSLSVGTGDVGNEAELAACLAGYTTDGYPDGNSTICSWTITPEKPGTSSGLPLSNVDTNLQAAEFAAICAQGLSPRLCQPFRGWFMDRFASIFAAPDLATMPDVAPAGTRGRLSSFTCSWWRGADEAHRVGMVQRIRNLATGRVDGTTAVGYGAGMSDARAYELFEDRCSVFHTGPFALYKLYGAAAPFSALTR